MEIIASGRKTSRTTRLIEMSAEAEKRGEINYIVCRDHRQAYAVSQKAKEMGLNIGFPLIFDEFLKNSYHGVNINHFLIDDADQLLQSITVVPIKAIVVEVDVSD